MVFKLIVKFIFIIAIKFSKFEILPLDSVSNSTNTFKEMSVEKEISLIKL